MNSVAPVLLSLVAGITLGGCFKTHTQSGVSKQFGPVHEDRQWFTVGGLVQLSGAAGKECKEGVSYVESGMNGTDILITAGLTIGASLLAGSVCELPEDPSDEELAAYSLCTSAIGGGIPLLLASRTVEYQCVPGGGPGVQVPKLDPVPGMVPTGAPGAN